MQLCSIVSPKAALLCCLTGVGAVPSLLCFSILRKGFAMEKEGCSCLHRPDLASLSGLAYEIYIFKNFRRRFIIYP